MQRDVIILPLKRFDIAKDRLRSAGTINVSELARDLAVNVIEACAPRPVIVLSEDASVTMFAREVGADVFESDATSLNEAVQRAYATLAQRFSRCIVVHGDLRDPSGLGVFEPGAGVTIVTDHHGLGTNVLVLPTGLQFVFGYGPDSARHHEAEARRLGLALTVERSSPWRFDVDEPSDLM